MPSRHLIKFVPLLLLLNWENRELSETADVAVETVNNVKSEIGSHPTREKIRGAFEAHGIEFLEFDGVCRRPEGERHPRGREGFEEFYYRFPRLKIHGAGTNHSHLILPVIPFTTGPCLYLQNLASI